MRFLAILALVLISYSNVAIAGSSHGAGIVHWKDNQQASAIGAMSDVYRAGAARLRKLLGVTQSSVSAFRKLFVGFITPEPAQTLIKVTEVAISVTEFLQTLSVQYRWLLDNRIRDAATIDDAVGDVSDLPFMLVEDLKGVFKVAKMSNEEHVNFIRKVIIQRAKEVNPDLLTR